MTIAELARIVRLDQLRNRPIIEVDPANFINIGGGLYQIAQAVEELRQIAERSAVTIVTAHQHAPKAAPPVRTASA